MKTIITVLLLLICINQNVQASTTAQFTNPSIVKHFFHHKIESKVLNQSRSIDIYVPDNYYITSESITYPVIYLLDGEFLFLPVVGAVKHLSASSLMPDTIVVAINNFEQAPQRSTDVDTEQRVDVLPRLYRGDELAGWGNYQANKHFVFLQQELIPFIEEHYRVNQFKILTGVSPTATFALYSAWQEQDLFNAYIAINHWPLSLKDQDGNSITANIVNSVKNNNSHKKYFYLAQLEFDPEDTEQTKHEYQLLATRLNQTNTSNLVYKTELIPGYGYNTTLKAFLSAMELIFPRKLWEVKFRDFISDDAGKSFNNMMQYYQSLEQEYGFEVIPKLRKWWATSDDLIALSRRTQDKVKVLVHAIHLYGRSANAHTYLADELEKQNKLAEAMKHREKAVELAKLNNNIRLQVFEQNLQKLQQLTSK